MTRTLSAGVLALAGFCIFSCQSPSSTTAPANTAAAASITDTIAPNPNGGGGAVVPMAQITPCLQAYQTTMAQYGVTTDSPAVPIKKCPATTYQITTSESLTYLTLRHWLDSMALSIDSAGKGANVNIQIMPGICTQQLVTAMNMPASRVGRISFFLVPTLMGTSASSLKTRAVTADGGGGSGGGGGGVEVGGLEP
ncbi:MAG TPA: hypothetical protein VNU70_03085 [Puia sp.]|nr:hypothetical protein [Puia sp.]